MNDTTFVSCFYDIGRKHDEDKYKFESYFVWIEKLFSLDIKLVFYTSQQLYSKINSLNKTKNIFILIFDEIPLFKEKERLSLNWNKFITNNPKKDTLEFAILTHSKFYFLEQSIKLDYYNTKYFAWIDAGISKVVKNIEILPKLSQFNDKIKICQINNFTFAQVRNPNFYLQTRYGVAGGFFTGSKENMLILIEKINKVREELLSKHSVFGLEQEYISRILFDEPELFFPYYGDFDTIFTNYPK